MLNSLLSAREVQISRKKSVLNSKSSWVANDTSTADITTTVSICWVTIIYAKSQSIHKYLHEVVQLFSKMYLALRTPLWNTTSQTDRQLAVPTHALMCPWSSLFVLRQFKQYCCLKKWEIAQRRRRPWNEEPTCDQLLQGASKLTWLISFLSILRFGL